MFSFLVETNDPIKPALLCYRITVHYDAKVCFHAVENVNTYCLVCIF